MRVIIFCLTILGASSTVWAQSHKSLKLFAYSQIVIPGVSQKDIIAEGGEQNRVDRKKSKNTWVYASFPADVELKKVKLYIDGKKYDIEIKEIAKTPVTYTDYNIPDFPKTIELVPVTENRVIQFIPTGEASFKPCGRLKKFIKDNEVVLSYKVKGKRYYSLVKKMTSIEPAVAS